jgi:hypothetical protein
MRLVGARATLAGLAFTVLATLLLSDRIKRQTPDLEVYWRAGVRAAAGEPLYRASDEHYQFKYLPAFAILAIPLGWLPLETAKVLWFATSVALLLLLIALSLRLPGRLDAAKWLLIAAAVVTMGKFYGHELILGQVNLLFGVIVVTAVLALRGGRDAAAGALTALAVVVKPYALIFLPWLVAQGRVLATFTAAAGVAVALVLPLVSYRVTQAIALHVDWWDTVTASTEPNLLNQDNVSIAAMFAKWLGPGAAAWWLSTIAVTVLLGTALYVFVLRGRIRFPEGLEAALLLTMIPLLSPQGWDYVFLIATPAVVYLVNYRAQLPRGLRVLVIVSLLTIGLSLFDVMGRANYARFMALSIITMCFLVVIAGLVELRRRGVA